LAGPVVAAAVIFERNFVECGDASVLLAGLTDSKKLSAKKRAKFFSVLMASPHIQIGVGLVDAETIDEINILQATHKAMALAVADLPVQPDYVLVDGLPVKTFPCESKSIVGGDSKSLSIAAASVIAKVVRDEHMLVLDQTYPRYHFAKHKGYGTQLHIESLFEFGPCPEHRYSFRPVREAEKMHNL
jgi:ribonuclease HII